MKFLIITFLAGLFWQADCASEASPCQTTLADLPSSQDSGVDSAREGFDSLFSLLELRELKSFREGLSGGDSLDAVETGSVQSTKVKAAIRAIQQNANQWEEFKKVALESLDNLIGEKDVQTQTKKRVRRARAITENNLYKTPIKTGWDPDEWGQLEIGRIVAFSKDASIFATVEHEGHIAIHSTETGELLYKFYKELRDRSINHVKALFFSRNDKRLIVVTNRVSIFNVKSRRLIKSFKLGGVHAVRSAAVSPDGKKIAIEAQVNMGDSGEFDLETGERTFRIKKRNHGVWYDEEGFLNWEQWISNGRPGVIRVFRELSQLAANIRYPGLDISRSTWVLSRDGRTLAVGTEIHQEQELKIWRAGEEVPYFETIIHSAFYPGIEKLAFSPRERFLLVGIHRKPGQIYDLKTKEKIAGNLPKSIVGFFFSDNGEKLAIHSDEGVFIYKFREAMEDLRLWDGYE